MGLGWWFAGVIMYASIIGISYGKICIIMGQYIFFPFGKDTINKNELYGTEIFLADCMTITWNLLWFLVMGWWLALAHLIFATINFITIIGISSGRRHLQLACISISPLGKIIANEKDSREAKKQNAQRSMQKLKDELSVYNKL